MPHRDRKTDENDTCDVHYVNEERVQAAMKTAPDDALVSGLSETFRLLGDPTRIKIIAALSQHELCVCDLAEALHVTGSAVSHQLRLLRGQRLVRYRKEGKIAYYTLDDDHIRNLFAEGVRHVRHG